MEFHNEYQDIDGCVIDDPLVLAISCPPELVEPQVLYVNVDISDRVSMRNTYADFVLLLGRENNLHVNLDIYARKFLEYYLIRIAWLARFLKGQPYKEVVIAGLGS